MNEYVLAKMSEIDKRLQNSEEITVEDAHYYNIHHDAVVFYYMERGNHWQNNTGLIDMEGRHD